MTMAREYDWRANAEPKAEVVARYSA
jgi:hypothetical protein